LEQPLRGSLAHETRQHTATTTTVTTRITDSSLPDPPHPPSPVGGGGEDLDDLWLEIDTLGERLEDLTDSVSFLLMLEDRGLPEWPAN